MPAYGWTGCEGNCFTGMVCPDLASTGLRWVGRGIIASTGVGEREKVAVLVVVDSDCGRNCGHGERIGFRCAGVVVRPDPACHMPISSRSGSEGDQFTCQVFPCRATLRLRGAGGRVSAIAAVRQRQGVTVLFVRDAGRMRGGRHIDGVGQGRADVVFRARPACHMPVSSGSGSEGDQFTCQVFPCRTTLRFAGLAVGSAPCRCASASGRGQSCS